MEKRHEDNIRSRMIPVPQTFSASYDVWKITDDSLVILRSNAEDAEQSVRDFFAKYCHASPQIRREAAEPEGNSEAYTLDVTPERCILGGNPGYALKSIRQLMESERGVLCSPYKQLPCVKIQDSPALAFRGIHLCWFPETKAWEIEKQIRMAAYYKFNTLVLESWGVLQFESHPEFCWGGEYAVSKQEIRRLISLGKSLGIRLVPQLNLFGHASCSRNGTGKHVLLNRHPEYEPLFEPAGWTWCISNPATRQYLTDLVLELCDLFDNPPYFHIGCDEAYTAESCSLCMHDYQRKLGEHLTYFHDLLAARGIRAMMWHDMLLCSGDPRFKGCIVNGNREAGYDTLISRIPKTMIICDWQYGESVKDGPVEWPTSEFFREQGFQTIVCPWNNPAGTASLGKFAAQNGLFGLLQTVWHHGHDSGRLTNILGGGANAAWSPDVKVPYWQCEQLNHHLRQIDFEMGLMEYMETGSEYYQVDPHPAEG